MSEEPHANGADRVWVELVRDELLSVLRQTLQHLRAQGMAPEDVHRARRLLKQANALALLLIDAVGPPAERAARDARVFRRELGEARDLDVIGETLEGFAPDLSRGSMQALRATLAARRQGPETNVRAPNPASLRRELRWLAGEVARWNLGGVGTPGLLSALRRSYRKARLRGELAFASLTPLDLHELRKAVIIHREQLATLDPIWPKLVHSWCSEAQNLREALGRANDLALVTEFTRLAAPSEADAVAACVAKARATAIERAGPAFARLFCERPKHVEHRLAAWIAHPKRPPEVSQQAADAA
jgi:CHAD domain-containing protein